jgi:tetratricopeptide (TPR) repeat protein
MEEPHRAKATYEHAISLGHPQITSWAALNLGDLLARLEDLKGALQAYELLVFLRNPELASAGALKAARLCTRLGQKDRAQTAYEQAIDLGPPEVARTAAGELQSLLNVGQASDEDSGG